MGYVKKVTLTGFFILGASLPSQAEQTSDFKFSISCANEVRSEFNRGVRLLHSFEYLETAKIFDQIIEKDPDCAMAYWGAAMSIWHPLWKPPTKANLAAGAALLAKTHGLTPTKRESDYISALSAFFSSTDIQTNLARAGKYSIKMKAIHEKYRDTDVDATVFYALSLVGCADPRDKSYHNQYQSGALLDEVQKSHPTHPGALHYSIHSYDYPGLAHLALEDATQYAAVAKDSAHAQHMPSHIFTRLGLWEQSLASNHDSVKSAAEYTRTAHLKTHYDEGLHGMDYLIYAMLQTGRDKEARDLLDRLAEIGKTSPKNFKAAFTYGAAYARYTLERRAWKEASQIKLVVEDFPWEKFPWAESIHYFARGIGAARSGQIKQAKAELATLKRLQKSLIDSEPLYWRIELLVQAEAVASWILLKEGKMDAALALASMAAYREDAVDKHPVTPGEVIPARELYAEMLFEVGGYKEALSQYQRVLKASPNRLNALRGAALAAKALGRDKVAQEYRAHISAQIKSGDRKMAGG